MEISEKIKFMRIFKGWSQEEMAEKLNMTVSGYSKIEHGQTDIPFSRLEQIAKTFKIELSDLLGLSEKNVFHVIGYSNSTHDNSTISSISSINVYSCDVARFQHENEKLQLIIEQKDRELALVQQQLLEFRDIIALLKGTVRT